MAEVPSASATAGIAYPDVAAKPDDEVYSMLFPGRGERESVYEQPDWARIHRELAHVGVLPFSRWIDTSEFNMRQRHGQSMLES